MLTPFVPYPPVDGGRIRILGLLDSLASKCRVDVLALAREESDRDAVVDLRKRGHTVQAVFDTEPSSFDIARALRRGTSFYLAKYWSNSFQSALAGRLSSTKYDVVQCEYPYTGQFRFGAPRIGASWVLDAHNVEHVVSRRLEQLAQSPSGFFYRRYARRETQARRREEVSICRSMDAVITVSHEDRSALAQAVPGLEPVVVPNGVDLARMTLNRICETEQPMGLFVGKLDYRPNVDGVRWFVSDVLPGILEQIPTFEFVIVGSGDPHKLEPVLRSPGVRFLGRIADVVPELQKTWMVVAPLRAGGGTRLKILEGLAAGRPVITTPVGHEGLDVVAGQHLLVAREANEFARAVVRLCRNPALRLSLGQSGRELVEQLYGWDRVTEPLQDLYGALAARRAEAR